MPFDEDQGTDVFAGTDNATTFHSQDAPNTKRLDGPTETKREQMKRLFTEYQTGTRNGKWGDNAKLRQQDNGAMFDAISSQLELPTFLCKRGQLFLKKVNLSKYGQPARLVIFSLCAQLYNLEAREQNRYHPNKKQVDNPDRFIEQAQKLGLSSRNINSVYNKIGGDILHE